MNTLSFNSNFSSKKATDKDVLSVYNRSNKKKLTIRQGMSANEISDVVSEKIIDGIKHQFEKTKRLFEEEKNKK